MLIRRRKMRYIMILTLLFLAGCATNDEYRENSLKPTPNRIACPTGTVVVVQKHGGGRLGSVGGERWSCEDPDAIDRESMDEDDMTDWED
jgi:hypothetical protein